MRDFTQNPLLRLRLALLLGLFLVAAGTLGYVVIEHMSFLDALFMTVITLSSVGYGEVQPLDVPGQIFTIVLIVVGLGTAAWLFAIVLETLTSEQTRRVLAQKRMNRVINSLNNHYIVCGYGRIGGQISDGYTQNKIPFLVIERDPDRIGELRDAGTPCIEGDAADDSVLVSAGIHRAAALISVTPTDASNTFIVLSARGVRGDLFIVARADAPQNEAKLLRAGASKVISPYTLGGRWMAATAINPALTDFIAAITQADPAAFAVREVMVSAASVYAGQTFGNAQFKQKTGAQIVAMRPASQASGFFPNPPYERQIVAGDVLIALGSPAQLSALANLLNP